MQTQGPMKSCSKELFDQVSTELGMSERARFCAEAVMVHGASLEGVVRHMREQRGDRVYASQVSKWASLIRAHLPVGDEPYVTRFGCFRKWYEERVETAEPAPDATGRLRYSVVSARELRADYERWAIAQTPQGKEIAPPKFGALMIGAGALQVPIANVMHYRGIRLKGSGCSQADRWFYESADGGKSERGRLLPELPRAEPLIDRETGKPIESAVVGFAATGRIVK